MSLPPTRLLLVAATAGLALLGCGPTTTVVNDGNNNSSDYDGGVDARRVDASCACTVGSVICVGDGIATCEAPQDGGCPDWGPPVPCPEGQRCSPVLKQCVQAYRYYWLLGQLPAQTNVYLYSRDGATVTFGGTIAVPVTVELPPDTFVIHNAGDLGYEQTGTNWYFLDVTSEGDTDTPAGEFMINFDRMVVSPVTGSEVHGDGIHNKPAIALRGTYFFPFAQSGPEDDILVMYSPTPATVSVHIVVETRTYDRNISFTGLYVSPRIEDWLAWYDQNKGYSMRIDAAPGQQIAAAVFDEVGTGTSWAPSGYFYALSAGLQELYDEYMYIWQGNANCAYYVPASLTLTHYDASGAPVGTPLSFPGEESLYKLSSDLGYDVTMPYLVHVRGSAPFAYMMATPTATDVRATAAYMGWNASQASLLIYSATPAHIRIYDGRTSTTVATFDLAASSIRVDQLDTLGFMADEPFLMAVDADVPVYQEVVIPNVLRQYPGEIGPIVE